jgi:hypothetical protein
LEQRDLRNQNLGDLKKGPKGGLSPTPQKKIILEHFGQQRGLRVREFFKQAAEGGGGSKGFLKDARTNIMRKLLAGNV